MRASRYGYLVLLGWLLCLAPAWAQPTYPIQVNTHLLPPYSLYLSDYYSSSRDKLTVTLVNRDQRTPSVNVRLRLSITAAGGTRLQTNESAFFQPVLVETGSPVRLTQEDLAQYFQPNNLVTQGFLTAGRLPEGMVEFCIQAVEAYTGRALSASTCARAWITSQKPPLLSLPANNESVAFREPLNVMFQWTPMHQGLAQVEYDFILKELWDNGMTPQAAFAYSPEIYRETTRSTSMIYGAFQPPLLAGKRYAWCVRAKAREGMDELNVFQNDGYSEIRWFQLQDDCLPPEYVEAMPERSRVNFRWEPRPAHIGFTISYREKSADGTTQNAWKELATQEPLATVYGLKSGTMYEYRVGSMCMAGQPVYTPIMQVYMPVTDSARLAQCGIMPDLNLLNQDPIKELKTSEVFRAGDFPVTIVTISGANGTFTGQGFTMIPWLNDAKVAVEFRNIGINTDRQMIRGIVEAKYDKKEGQIGNLDELLEGGFNQGNVVTGITRTDTSFNFVIPDESSFSLDDDGQLVIVDADKKPHVIPTVDPGETPKDNEGDKVLVFPMTVKDKNGTVYKVEKVTETVDGQEKEVVKATKLGTIGVPLPADAFDTTMIAEDMAIVRFYRGNGRYSFDTWLDYYKDIQLIRVKYKKLGSDYYAPWKLLPGGESDEVSASIQVVKSDVIDPKKVIFITKKGTRYDFTYVDSTYTFRVTSGPEGDVQELYALHPKGDGKYYTLGKLGIATYARQEREVVLVAVENTHVDYDVIERTLHTIYDSVGIRWTVHRDDFPYADDGGFMANGTGLSTYNDKMRTLNAAYRAAKGKDFKPGANYIFFLKATGNIEVGKRELTGFMPRGAQFGYIFTSETADAVEPIAVAHELGHGRWKLYHPFDKNYGGYPAAEEKTNNLMAYGNGPHIAKWQWDQLADPALVVNVFQGDERSEYALVKNIEHLLPFANKDQAGTPVSFTFFARSGKPITVPINGLQSVAFSTGDQAGCSSDKFQISPFGTLTKFVLKDKNGEHTYVAYWDCNANRFDSYRSGNDVYYDKLTNASITKAIFGLPTVIGGDLKFKAALIGISAEQGVEKYTASGEYQRYNFLADRVKDIPESAYGLVTASFAPEFDVDVRQFILDNFERLAWNGGKFYNKDIYLFTHATQLQKYGILTGCFRSGVPEGFFEAIVAHTPPVTTANGIVLSPGVTLTGADLIDHWEKYDVNYYPVLAKAVKVFNVPENATAQAAYDLLKPFATDNESGVLDCYWQTITLEQRIQLIELLIPENSAFDRREEIIQLLITTTKTADQRSMLEKLKGEKDEYTFFKKVWDVLDSDERIVLGYTLMKWLKTYDNRGPDYPKDEYKHFTDVTLKTTKTNGTGDNFFVLNKTNWVEDVFLETFEVSLESANTVYIKYDGDPVEDALPEYYDWSGKPFDWIVARIEDDFPKYGLKAGNYLVAPAVFMLAFDKHRDKQQNQAALRVFGDGIVLASVVASGGGTTPLASAWFTVNATTAAIDIGVTVFRDQIDAELGPEAGTYWDVLYGTVNLFSLGKTFIVPTAYKIANGINRISQFRLVVNQVDNVAREIATYGNLSEKLTYLAQLDKLLNLLKASQFRKIAEARFLQWKLLELRFKVLRSFPDSAPFTELLIQDGNLTVGGQLSLGTAEFIGNVPTLTGNIRWLPQTVTNISRVDSYSGIVTVVNGVRSTMNIEIVQDLSNAAQFYVRQTPAVIDESIASTLAKQYKLDEKTLELLRQDLLDPTFAALLKRKPDLLESWIVNKDLLPVLRRNSTLLEGTKDLIKYDLFQDIGNARKSGVSNIHRYTVNGDYLNNPMRGPVTDHPLHIPDVRLDEFGYQSYLKINEAMAVLRKTDRLETGVVIRGRAFSQAQFDILFGPNSPPDIPLKGYQSASRDINVAKHFAASADFLGPKVRLLIEIKSKNGVYVGDFADWGKTLGPINHAGEHPAIQVQEEVLMEEGLFRKLSEPEYYFENGVQQFDRDGYPWMIVRLEELGHSFRQITK